MFFRKSGYKEQIRKYEKKRNEIIDITNLIDEIIKNRKIDDGFLIIYIPHTTAGVFINEGADENVKKDIINTD